MAAVVESQLFWQKLFRIFHGLHRGTEPADARNYKNIRMALYSLRTLTGMTGEQLAIEIGISSGQLNMFEIRGGVLRPEYCARCSVIALSYFYPKLAEYFDLEGARNYRHTRRRRAGTSEEKDFGGE